MDTSVDQASTLLKALMACGILASLLHLMTDRLAGALWRGYSFVSESISELSAVGSSTRPLVLTLHVVSGLLMIAFGFGVWRAAGGNTALRIAAGLIVGNALVSIVTDAFFPTRFAEALGNEVSNANVVLGALGMVLFVLAIVLGAVALHGWFRVLSIGILVAYAVLTVVGLLVRRTPAPSGDVVPTIGVQERTMMYSYLLWMAALALVLLRGSGHAGSVVGGAV